MKFLASFVLSTLIVAYWFLTKLLLGCLTICLEPLAVILSVALAIYVLTWGMLDDKRRK